ncbi:fungal-specific transcription factor domain-containing protein [Lipomyces japonicus]|uniref:fungal-specific transcription factor domain-containing protein n=1 Tax=Lipomyces japonicus TaxID=56871 RepID=UPI0034CE1C07
MEERASKKRRVGLKRSRHGCLQCRQRRKKCSFERPFCASCTEREWKCTYPDAKDHHRHSTSPSSEQLGIFDDLDHVAPSMFATDSDGNVVSPGAMPPPASIGVPAVKSEEYAIVPWAPSPPVELDGLDPLSILQFTREQKELVYHFTVTISSVISYYRQEGPFRRLVLNLLIPVPHPSSTAPLLSSLCALASAHKSFALGIQDATQIQYHTSALTELITLLDGLPTRLEDENTQNVLLSSILILVYYEIARGGFIDSVCMHLSGAYRIITSFLNHVIYKLQNATPSTAAAAGAPAQASDPWHTVSRSTIFLFRIFQYFDVICSLSRKGPMLDSSLQLHHFLSTYSRLHGAGEDDTDGDGDHHDQGGIDPVIGLASDLWPLVVRLCILCNQCEFGKSVSPDVACQASLLELEISLWKVPSLAAQDTNMSLGMQSAAKVYQLATQIYLLRTLHVRPNADVADQIQRHVRAALDHLARVCTLEANMAALLWPVSVVASECVDSIDRGFIKVVFQKLGKRQGMANVVRGLQVVEASWSGRAAAEAVMYG